MEIQIPISIPEPARALDTSAMSPRLHRVCMLSALSLTLLLCAAASASAAAAETWDSLVAAEIEWSTGVASAHMHRLTYLQKLAAAGPSAEGGAGVNAELASVRAPRCRCAIVSQSQTSRMSHVAFTFLFFFPALFRRPSFATRSDVSVRV